MDSYDQMRTWAREVDRGELATAKLAAAVREKTDAGVSLRTISEKIGWSIKRVQRLDKAYDSSLAEVNAQDHPKPDEGNSQVCPADNSDSDSQVSQGELVPLDDDPPSLEVQHEIEQNQAQAEEAADAITLECIWKELSSLHKPTPRLKQPFSDIHDKINFLATRWEK